MLTEAAGEVPVQVPRDRAGTFEPVVVRKRQRRLSDVDAVAISLYAKGLTTGEISAHFQEVCGASVSKDSVSRITHATRDWCMARHLSPVFQRSRREPGSRCRGGVGNRQATRTTVTTGTAYPPTFRTRPDRCSSPMTRAQPRWR